MPSLLDVFQHTGFAVWQLQVLESTFATYLVIVHQAEPAMARADVGALFNKAESRTLGQNLKQLRSQPGATSLLVERIEALVEDRNWLIHEARARCRGQLTSADGVLLVIGRIQRIGEEALGLASTLGLLIEDHLTRQGFTKQAIDDRQTEILHSWYPEDGA